MTAPAPVAPAYLYTTQDMLERRFSESGVSLRADDLAGGDITSYWEEVAAEATLKVDQYAQRYYQPSDLYRSYWVTTRATWIGCYLHSLRRGNPALFVQQYLEIIQELQAVANGSLQIPELPTRADMTPVMSTLVIDERFPLHKQRVHPSLSTGGTDGSQFLAYYEPFDWL